MPNFSVKSMSDGLGAIANILAHLRGAVPQGEVEEKPRSLEELEKWVRQIRQVQDEGLKADITVPSTLPVGPDPVRISSAC